MNFNLANLVVDEVVVVY